ncbi:MAG TPA: MFS transporter [Balneolales bacterium]|nr:MFS transporter [Balneolales bacterium]
MYNRKLVFWASCLGMLLFGITMTTLGPILPKIMLRFGMDKANAGALFSLMSLGILLGSLIFGPLVDRYGYKELLIVCSVFVLAGLEGIALTPSLGLLKVAVFVFGFGGGIINGGTNALVSDISEEGRSAGLALLGVFFGIGAFSVPLVLGLLLDHFSYRTIIAGVGFIVLIPLLFFIVIRFPEAKQKQGFPIRKGAGLLKETTLLLFGLILFLESGMEITAGGWTTAFFNEELAMSANRAVYFQSLFWVGMMLARLLLGTTLKSSRPSRLLYLFISLAFSGSILLLAGRSLVLAAAGIFIIGAGFAAVFPLILGYVGDLYSQLSGTAFSIVLVMALTGGMILPWLAGVLGDAYGLRTSFLIIPLSLLVMMVILTMVLQRFRATKSKTVKIRT